jgi:cytoskeletal protein RodZ
LSYQNGILFVSTDEYNEKTLREYLLGLLPEAETERLDELSVTEEEFVQELRKVEDDLIDAYVNGELTGPELIQFPRQYLSSQLGVERVRFAQAFRDSNQLPDEVEPAKTEAETRVGPMTSKASFFSLGNWSTLKWGLVTASLLILLVASWFIFQQSKLPKPATPQVPDSTAKSVQQGSSEPDRKANEKPTPAGHAKIDPEHQAQQSPTPQANPSRIIAFVLKPQLRSVSQPVELTIPNEITTVALTLQLEPGDTPYYRPILTEASSDRAIWQGGRIKSTTTGEMSVLQVRVPAALFTQRAYKIRVVGIYPNGTTETASEYNFRVVK